MFKNTTSLLAIFQNLLTLFVHGLNKFVTLVISESKNKNRWKNCYIQ